MKDGAKNISKLAGFISPIGVLKGLAVCLSFVPFAHADQSDWDTSKVYLYGRNDGKSEVMIAWQTSDTTYENMWATWWRYDEETSSWTTDGSHLTSETDNFVFTPDAVLKTDSFIIYYPQTMTVGSLYFQDNAVNRFSSPLLDNCLFTVSGDFTKVGKGDLTVLSRGMASNGKYYANSILIKGDLIYGAASDTGTYTYLHFGNAGDPVSVTDGYNGPMASVNIVGDLHSDSHYYGVTFNVGLTNYETGGSVYVDPDNPDIIVSGLVTGLGVVHISERGAYTGHITSMAVGGVNGGTIFRNSSATTTTNVFSYLVLNNAAGTSYTSTGIVYDDSNSFKVEGSTESAQALGFNSRSKVGIIMNGEGTQIFSSTIRMKFSGGVTVNRGTLLFDSSAVGAAGAYITESDGSRTYQCTHGNLTMNGGTFGFIYTNKGGEWAFDEMFWKSGNLLLNVYDENNSYDTLVFTGMFGYADGETDLIKLTFQGNSVATLYEEKKIISWDSIDSSITEDSFIANNVVDPLMGEEYEAHFRVAADGLYVQYVAVPEPAIMGLVFGALALFAARRRKS